jgi:hypothetical protein
MEGQTKLRGALGWTGIILFGVAGLLLLQWPLTRPWLIGSLTALMILTIGKILYGLAGQQQRFDRRCVESLAFPIGMICLLANMLWDRPLLEVTGLILILGSSARAWHESRRVSDSSGTITR